MIVLFIQRRKIKRSESKGKVTKLIILLRNICQSSEEIISYFQSIRRVRSLNHWEKIKLKPIKYWFGF